MAKITARGAREVMRFTRAGGETVVLTEGAGGKTRALRKWTSGASYTSASIPVGHKANGTPIYTDSPTREQFETWALGQGFERTAVRR
jgi:hypothetical protein